MKKEKKCLQCKKAYVPGTKFPKFCSAECACLYVTNLQLKMRIEALEKAIENVGNDYMQTIYVASKDIGMGQAMSSGDYISLSSDPLAHEALKEVLKVRLEELKAIERINNGNKKKNDNKNE